MYTNHVVAKTGTKSMRYCSFFALFLTVPVMAQVSNDALVGYWRFDQALNDWSCQGLDLQVPGIPSLTNGLLGSGLDLNGSGTDNATRSVDDNVLDFGTSDFTIQIWVRFNSTSGEMVLIEKLTGAGSPPTTQGWTITKTSGSLIRFGAATATLDTAPQTLSTGVWYHIVVRHTNAGRSIWVNGVSQATDNNTAPVLDSTLPLLLGRRNASAGQGALALNGQLDEIAIWKRALSDGEIASLYNSGSGRHVTPCVPTLSEWGLIVMGLLTVTAGTVVAMRRRVAHA